MKEMLKTHPSSSEAGKVIDLLWHTMNYPTVQVDFQLSSFNFTQFEPHGLTCSELCCAHIKWSTFWKLPGLGISNINLFLLQMRYSLYLVQ